MSANPQRASDPQLQRDWLRLRPMILKAAKFTNGLSEADLLRGVVSGQFSFWPGERSFIFASVDRHPQLVRLNIFLASGDHNEVFEIEPQVVAWGKQLGATQAFTECRVGLDRLNVRGKRGYYSDAGYTRDRVVYVKEI